MRTRLPLPALAVAALTCCWHDMDHPPEKHQYTLVSFTPGPTWTLVLTDPACPAQTVTETGAPDRADDVACLAKLPAGPVEESKQRVQQGCMPGTVFRTTLGGCRFGGGHTTKLAGPCR